MYLAVSSPESSVLCLFCGLSSSVPRRWSIFKKYDRILNVKTRTSLFGLLKLRAKIENRSKKFCGSNSFVTSRDATLLKAQKKNEKLLESNKLRRQELNWRCGLRLKGIQILGYSRQHLWACTVTLGKRYEKT